MVGVMVAAARCGGAAMQCCASNPILRIRLRRGLWRCRGPQALRPEVHAMMRGAACQVSAALRS